MICMAKRDPGMELAAIRKKIGVTIARFARDLGVVESRYKNWEYGKTLSVPEEVMRKARLLSARNSREVEGPNATIVQNPQLVEGFASSVAVRSWASASAASFADDDDAEFSRDPVGNYEVPVAFLVPGRDPDLHDLVRVAGRSMAPLIQPGDRVLFFRDQVHKKNTIVLAEDPDGHVRIKVLRDISSHWELHSLSPDGCTFTDLTGWKVYGYAVAIMRDMDEPGPNITWPFGLPIKV